MPDDACSQTSQRMEDDPNDFGGFGSSSSENVNFYIKELLQFKWKKTLNHSRR